MIHFISFCSRSMLAKLRGMTSEQNTESDYAAMLRSMCHWGKADDILELASDWLKPALLIENPGDESTDSANSSKRVNI